MASRLWRNRSYRWLWTAAGASNLGSMVYAMALPYLAVTALAATPRDMASLQIARLLPGLLLGLWASGWIDRLPRLPLLRASDLVRAAAVAWIPVAAWQGWLTMPQIVAVTAVLGFAGFVFHVAHVSVLPGLVESGQLVEANAKLRAADSATEGLGFGLAGLLIEIASAPFALLVDALSYLVSALCLLGVREPVVPHRAASHASGRSGELLRGVAVVRADPVLRHLAVSAALAGTGLTMLGVAYMIFAVEVLGIAAGLLGLIAATGAVSSFAGAAVADRFQHWRPGPAMVGGLLLLGFASLLIPAAPWVAGLAVPILLLHQIGDGGWVVYEVHHVSVRQQRVDASLQGRVHGVFSVLDAGSAIAGAVLGGAVGEWLGLQPTLALGGGLLVLAALWLALSPVRRA